MKFRSSGPQRPVLRIIFVSVLLGLFLSGCQGDWINLFLPQPTMTPTPTEVVAATEIPTVVATPQPQPTVSSPQLLTVWVPPDFDPTNGSPAGDLLQARIKAFLIDHPDAIVHVRVKAVNGPGGLLTSLTAASAAAPEAVPAIIALSRSDLETAALKGLVYPLDGTTGFMQDPDWYNFARQMAQVQDSLFGIPFGGDALLLVYRPERIGIAPTDWKSIFSLGKPLVFPADDPQGMVTLALYLSAGGTIEDSQHRPQLQADVLSEVLSLFAEGARQGTFPYWLGQYQTDGQVWQAYREQRAHAMITWVSPYLSELPVDSTAVSLPVLGSESYTLADGWLWAVSDPVSARRSLDVSLIEYLTESGFLSKWTAAAGYLPPRPTSLASWDDQSLKTMLSQIALSAQSMPTTDLLSSIGPVLEEATVNVIKNQADPVQAAEAAVEKLGGQ